jgi:predicted nucleic acid-binding Zn ribbon protein
MALEPLKDVLGRYLQSSGLGRKIEATALDKAWQEILGPLAVHTRFEGVRREVATVIVDNASLLSELHHFQKASLLAALRERVPGVFVRELRFKLGKV